jgi:hypothetical protein
VAATEAGGARGSALATLAAFLAGGSASDAVDPSPVRLAPQVAGVDATNSTLFPLGSSTVTFRFQDAAGNVGSATTTLIVVLGQPSLSGTIITKGTDASGFYVDLSFKNTGTGMASNIIIGQLTLRTLAGTGTVTYNTAVSPPLPRLLGDLNVGATMTVRFYLNRPSTVTRFSITESGTVQNVIGTTYNFSVAQTVIP